jgi:hypothetical protein
VGIKRFDGKRETRLILDVPDQAELNDTLQLRHDYAYSGTFIM